MHDSLLYIVPKWPLIAVAAVATISTQPIKDEPLELPSEAVVASPSMPDILIENPYKGFEEALGTFVKVNKRNVQLIPELCEMYSIPKGDCEAYIQRLSGDTEGD